jgi:hypothetical protein
MTSKTPMRDLAQEITNIVAQEELFDTRMNALLSAIVVQMGSTCPQCRKDIAKKLKRCVPGMLAAANDIAAANTNGSSPPDCSYHN